MSFMKSRAPPEPESRSGEHRLAAALIDEQQSARRPQRRSLNLPCVRICESERPRL
jgi:hypothetical protein